MIPSSPITDIIRSNSDKFFIRFVSKHLIRLLNARQQTQGLLRIYRKVFLEGTVGDFGSVEPRTEGWTRSCVRFVLNE